MSLLFSVSCRLTIRGLIIFTTTSRSLISLYRCITMETSVIELFFIGYLFRTSDLNPLKNRMDSPRSLSEKNIVNLLLPSSMRSASNPGLSSIYEYVYCFSTDLSLAYISWKNSCDDDSAAAFMKLTSSLSSSFGSSGFSSSNTSFNCCMIYSFR